MVVPFQADWNVIIPYSKNIGKFGELEQFAQFFVIFTIFVTFPMQMDFNLPKFFPPNFLQS